MAWASALLAAAAPLDGSVPIWHPLNRSAHFVYFRSPSFVLPPASTGPRTAVLHITARQSPHLDNGSGNTQSKLACSYKLYVNGQLVTAGPGHNLAQVEAVQPASGDAAAGLAADTDMSSQLSRTPARTSRFEPLPDTLTQAVAAVNITALLNPLPAANVIGVASFFNWSLFAAEVPRMQAVLCFAAAAADPPGLACDHGLPPILLTNASWLAWQADLYHNPEGDNNGTPWYQMPNENLNQQQYPHGWAEPAPFVPPAGQVWTAAAVQPAFVGALYSDPFPPPALLTRKACAVTPVTSWRLHGSEFWTVLVDFGQEFSGGVNLSFPCDSTTQGVEVTVRLGEALFPNGSLIVPTQANQNYSSTWTLAGPSPSADRDPGTLEHSLGHATAVPLPRQAEDAPGAVGPVVSAPAMSAHESTCNRAMMQHEMIQFRYALVIGSPVLLTPDHARAWVLQHAVGGTGENPFEQPCARSTPVAPAVSRLRSAALSPTFATWQSSSPALDRVFNMTAYTAIATSLDVNVDSRTRQRDVCQVDALITNQEQYAIFPPQDWAMQRRTALFSFSNDSSPLQSATEFRQCAMLMVFLDVWESGSKDIALDTWSDSDLSLLADNKVLNSLQFYASLRYFNLSGRGLLSFPPDCGGPWVCSVLADWPMTTRDGYIVDPSNTDDAIRNGLGILTIEALGKVAEWLGKNESAARYQAMAATVRQALKTWMQRCTSDECYFVDGAAPPGSLHAAIYSSLYAAAAGVADGDPALATMLSRYIIRRDLGPSSCMTGKWVLEACYRLAIFDPTGSAADYALQLLERTSYPSWGYMIARGATISTEAWRPEDKHNMDWAHPWCAAPAFAIPRLLLGVQPLAPGWTVLRIAPQPSTLASINASIPTPQGVVPVTYLLASESVSVVTRLFPGTRATVCLVHPRFPAASQLSVDGALVRSTRWGRLMCTADAVSEGPHTIALAQ